MQAVESAVKFSSNGESPRIDPEPISSRAVKAGARAKTGGTSKTPVPLEDAVSHLSLTKLAVLPCGSAMEATKSFTTRKMAVDPGLRKLVIQTSPTLVSKEEKSTGACVSENRLAQLSYRMKSVEQLQGLFNRLRRDSADKTDLLMQSLLQSHLVSISGIPQKTSEGYCKKDIAAAVCDVWRTANKYEVFQENKGKFYEKIQDVDPEAYTEGASACIDSLNERVLRLLQLAPSKKAMKVTIPEHVTWKGMEDASRWVEANRKLMEQDVDFCCFVRSFSQERYSGGLTIKWLLSHYGEMADEPRPDIIAKIDSSKLKFCRFFSQEGSFEEAMYLPVRITQRKDKSFVTDLLWTIIFSYDARSVPTRIRGIVALGTVS